jgi:type IV pilus assembly protein PilX
MLMISTRARGRSTGFALITALVMLLVITLLAIGGARLAIDSKRMSRNQRDTDIAFQAAEAALRDAEYDIQNASAGNGSATNTRLDVQVQVCRGIFQVNPGGHIP